MKIISAALMAVGILLLTGCTPQPDSFTTDDLYGIWTEGGSFFQFNEDGTYAIAGSFDELTLRPTEFGDFRFEGSRLTYIPNEESLKCAGKTGIYELEMAEDGRRFKSTRVEDTCYTGTSTGSVFFRPYEP